LRRGFTTITPVNHILLKLNIKKIENTHLRTYNSNNADKKEALKPMGIKNEYLI
jgi:hypothetical protein